MRTQAPALLCPLLLGGSFTILRSFQVVAHSVKALQKIFALLCPLLLVGSFMILRFLQLDAHSVKARQKILALLQKRFALLCPGVALCSQVTRPAEEGREAAVDGGERVGQRAEDGWGRLAGKWSESVMQGR
jgi:hypothetical protein